MRIPTIAEKGTGLFDVIQYVDLGRLGVSIFFAISGFVICYSIKGEKTAGVRKFAFRRLFRLFPAFWVSLLLGVLIVWIDQGRPISAKIILANWSMIPAVFNQPLVLGLYWTLELELSFYLLVALLFYFGVLLNPMAIFFLCLIGVLIFGLFMMIPTCTPEYGPWATMPYHLSIMLWGVLYRYRYEGMEQSSDILGINVSLKRMFLLATIVVLAVPGAAIFNAIYIGDLEFFNDATAYLLAILIFHIGVSRLIIRWKPMVFLGTISYSLYLLHPIVFVLLSNGMRNFPGWGLSMHLSIYIILTILFTILFAAIVYFLVERPFILKSYQITKRTN